MRQRCSGCASIASDISGYPSRIFTAHSPDGLTWTRGPLALEGAGYDSPDLDAIHAEDMSLIPLEDNRLRLYYAACNKTGQWSIASAISNRVQNVSLH